LNALKDFWNKYIDDTKGSVTIKIHQVVNHTENQLNEYGNVGLFAEDSAESIHEIINSLSGRYAALDSSRRVTQVMRALEMWRKMATKKLSAKKEKGSDITAGKRKRVQGGADVEVGDSIVNPAICEAAQSFLSVFESDPKDKVALFRSKRCACCQDFLEKDVFVPQAYLPLHQKLCHAETAERFTTAKKRRT
jgi:hypothetical protein